MAEPWHFINQRIGNVGHLSHLRLSCRRRPLIHEEVPWYVSLFIAWLPFIIMISIASWFARRIGRSIRAPDGRPLGQIINEHTAELRRSNDLLEQMTKDLRQRMDALERR
jgi:hypothetical protein